MVYPIPNLSCLLSLLTVSHFSDTYQAHFTYSARPYTRVFNSKLSDYRILFVLGSTIVWAQKGGLFSLANEKRRHRTKIKHPIILQNDSVYGRFQIILERLRHKPQ
jgi:hypothetical protein